MIPKVEHHCGPLNLAFSPPSAAFSPHLTIILETWKNRDLRKIHPALALFCQMRPGSFRAMGGCVPNLARMQIDQRPVSWVAPCNSVMLICNWPCHHSWCLAWLHCCNPNCLSNQAFFRAFWSLMIETQVEQEMLTTVSNCNHRLWQLLDFSAFLHVLTPTSLGGSGSIIGHMQGSGSPALTTVSNYIV